MPLPAAAAAASVASAAACRPLTVGSAAAGQRRELTIYLLPPRVTCRLSTLRPCGYAQEEFQANSDSEEDDFMQIDATRAIPEEDQVLFKEF